MKFTEEKLEKAFTELLRQEGFGYRKNKLPFSSEPNVSEEGLAVNLNEKSFEIGKTALDQQQNTGLGFFFAICAKGVQGERTDNHEKRWKNWVAIQIG